MTEKSQNNKCSSFYRVDRENFRTISTYQDTNLISSLLITPKVKRSSNSIHTNIDISCLNSINLNSSLNENGESVFSDDFVLLKEK